MPAAAQGIPTIGMPSTETPIRRLFGEWHRLERIMMAREAVPDDGTNAEMGELARIEKQIEREPMTCMEDLALKMTAMSWFWRLRPEAGGSARGDGLRRGLHGEDASMSSVRLTDGRVLHLPGMPFVLDCTGTIQAPPEADLAAAVPLIPADELLLFAGRLVGGARKRRRQPRYAEVNEARLRLARLCLERAIEDGIYCQPLSENDRSLTLAHDPAERWMDGGTQA
ncbi:hypothetical protein Rumeso_01360 [Rubellimicrobium mesophilum DSM 19309]|uniref:Uncharacterized protein n=2 Tax=Rubellimicrobium TaxID=295418 RepID=A0A017HRV8_9RHOB|nr:hypothetical protein Rumeso_01360 [Rubellimicrobium mesophilum DSM 19309]